MSFYLFYNVFCYDRNRFFPSLRWLLFLLLCLLGICDDHFRLICSCFTLPLYSLFWMGFLFWIAFIYLPHLRIFPFHTLSPKPCSSHPIHSCDTLLRRTMLVCFFKCFWFDFSSNRIMNEFFLDVDHLNHSETERESNELIKSWKWERVRMIVNKSSFYCLWKSLSGLNCSQ